MCQIVNNNKTADMQCWYYFIDEIIKKKKKKIWIEKSQEEKKYQNKNYWKFDFSMDTLLVIFSLL